MSISSGVGAFLGVLTGCFDAPFCFVNPLATVLHGRLQQRRTLPGANPDEKPGGSGMLVLLGFVMGAEFKSSTHCGGGGGDVTGAVGILLRCNGRPKSKP